MKFGFKHENPFDLFTRFKLDNGTVLRCFQTYVGDIARRLDGFMGCSHGTTATAIKVVASFELKLIFFRNTFCHHRSPFAGHKSVIF